MGDYDILWKGMLEDVFVDMMRFIFPSADEELDLEQGIVYLDKEMAELYPEPGKAIDSRVVDKLARMSRKDGKEQWLLLHIEVVRLVSRLFNCSFPARGHPNLSFCRQ